MYKCLGELCLEWTRVCKVKMKRVVEQVFFEMDNTGKGVSRGN